MAPPDARVLILGSMPGQASLAAGQYYAHPRNAFWPILAAYCGVPADAPYAERVAALSRSRIALWDVLQSCTRPGSLDSAISDPEPNDFAGLFRRCPQVDTILFNGGAAAALFARHVLPGLANPPAQRIILPSTSPAHAAKSLVAKQVAWHAALLGIPATPRA